ncbi:MAG: tryptophanyl-tRNA synthetase [Alphaproteobacteria bacterium]|nr:tryptophanyl-tRNA synthetase [Alphaproteobacteria bacterium]
MADSKPKKTVFSGIQPTGDLHIGNLIGAISLWVKEQDKHDNIFCIVDLHALTYPEEIQAERLKSNSLDVAALYLACGIDPEKSLVFIQSQVRQHSELAWMLNCVTPMGWMNRMTQFKSKSEGRETVGVGLYAYPILQAADILLYHADLVPVGEDQRQHIEITQDIAERFEHLFGYHFTRPEILVRQVGARIMGLDDPEAKMSKSASKSGHAIRVLDPPATILKKLKSAKTDSRTAVDASDLSPGVRNLVTIYHAFAGGSWDSALKRFDGSGYGALKTGVAEAVIAGLEPVQRRFHEIRDDEAGLVRFLTRSAEAAAERAEATMRDVRKAVGVW